ncbi:MAG: response regulator [Anaerolineales bacterium]|nr:response regulator [Anaerolineales bacterium]
MEQKYILLVEDNPDDELLTLRALRSGQVANDIMVAHDGAEALDILFARGSHADQGRYTLPELILLDLKLPKLDGLEVLQTIRQDARTRHLPVVVLTSSDEENDILESYSRGANSYIRKPVDFAQFTEAVKQLKLYWLVLNVPPPRSRLIR